MRSRKNRLIRLEAERASLCDPTRCYILRYTDAEPIPPVPSDAVPCPGCGEVHVRYIHEIVVQTREEAEEWSM